MPIFLIKVLAAFLIANVAEPEIEAHQLKVAQTEAKDSTTFPIAPNVIVTGIKITSNAKGIQ